MPNPGHKAEHLIPYCFKPGNDGRRNKHGNPHGHPRVGACVMNWVNVLCGEPKGKPKYTLQELTEIANAPPDDPDIGVTKRAAARALCEMVRPGRAGREALHAILDRSLGKPHVSASFDVQGLEKKMIILVDERDRALPKPNGGGGAETEIAGAPAPIDALDRLLPGGEDDG